MELTAVHWTGLLLTFGLILGSGLWSARTIHSHENYSLGGRSFGIPMIAGAIAGTIIGGGATVGTAQMAWYSGLSAWWFTLGSGIGFIVMGLFYAGPLRRTGLETIPQYLSSHYGPSAEIAGSLISSFGSLFSAVSSTLPGIAVLSALFGLPPRISCLVLMLSVLAYICLGGMKGAGISGMIKLSILWSTLMFAGWNAGTALSSDPLFALRFPADHWLNLFGTGIQSSMNQLLSLIVSILCTQTYAQAIFSASDQKAASAGCFAAAALVIPVGLPSIAIGLFMHAFHPDITPIMSLPSYILMYLPPWMGGIALAGILLSLISSIAGLTLGISTMLTRDIIFRLFPEKSGGFLLTANRTAAGAVLFLCSLLALCYPESQVLFWNYLSMALRGGGIFIPFSMALFIPGRISGFWASVSMLVSTASAVFWEITVPLPVQPLFVGLAVSLLINGLGMILKKKQTQQLSL